MKKTSYIKIRELAVAAVMTGFAVVIMYFDISIPIMPSFIKLDFSEIPALITAFAFGPLWGAAVCLVKNLIHLFVTQTSGVGELANFLLGASFVIPAGIIYRQMRTRKGAFTGMAIGVLSMTAMSFVCNLFLIYPLYFLLMPKSVILGGYRKINSGVEEIWQCLLIFNLPFTFVKGLLNLIIVGLIYKPLSPVIKKLTGDNGRRTA